MLAIFTTNPKCAGCQAEDGACLWAESQTLRTPCDPGPTHRDFLCLSPARSQSTQNYPQQFSGILCHWVESTIVKVRRTQRPDQSYLLGQPQARNRNWLLPSPPPALSQQPPHPHPCVVLAKHSRLTKLGGRSKNIWGSNSSFHKKIYAGAGGVAQ